MLALIGLSDDEVDLARRLGLPALLLFALGSWTVFGGFVLTYLPLSRRWIGLATWPPLLFVAFASRETHFVAQRDLDLAVPPIEVVRETSSERFRRWVAQVPPEIRSTWLPRWVGPAAQPSDRHRAGRDRRRCAPCGWPTLCRRPVRDQQHLRRQPGRDGVRCRCRAGPGHRSLREGAGCRIDEFARACLSARLEAFSSATSWRRWSAACFLSGSVHPASRPCRKAWRCARPLTGPGGGLGG